MERNILSFLSKQSEVRGGGKPQPILQGHFFKFVNFNAV